MAERKCGQCRQPGHTKAKCPGVPVPPEPDAFSVPAPAEDEFVNGRPIMRGPQPGPVFSAQFPGICEGCMGEIDPGDWIRADGEGGYVHEDCLPDSGTDAAAEAPEPVVSAELVPATVDAFSAPAPVIAEPAPVDDDPLTNWSGYLVKDPRDGEFRRFKKGTIKGFTRMTTFIKAASDSKAIESWQKRNVVIGAALRPDLVAQAKGLTHAEGKEQLDTIAELLAEAAGAKRGSSMGTALHSLTEKADQGDLSPLQDETLPEIVRGLLAEYRSKLIAYGFEVVPELIERTVFLPQYGGVAGTFDRVLYHRPSDTYVIADVKTGKNLDLGWDEIEAQEWGYATAYNTYGVWNHAVKLWVPPRYKVRTDIGLVMHLPIEGPDAGKVSFLATSLTRGAAYAEECGRVRALRAAKPKPVPWPSTSLPTPPAPAQAPSWRELFASVADVAEAGRLWTEARAAGVEPAELGELVKLAQDRLRSMS